MEDERLVVADFEELGQVGLGLAGIDEGIPVVAEDPERPREVEVDRARLEIARVVRLDPDAPGLELGPDVAIGKDAHARPPWLGPRGTAASGARWSKSASTSRLSAARSSKLW